MLTLTAALLLSSSAPATPPPFLGRPGTRAGLEQAFLETAFCRQYACVPGKPVGDYSTFRLKNRLEVWLEPCCDLLYGVRVPLGQPRPLTAGEVQTLRDLSRLALGQTVPFDYARVCSSAVNIAQFKPAQIPIKTGTGPWVSTVSCFQEDGVGGRAPSSYFTATLLG